MVLDRPIDSAVRVAFCEGSLQEEAKLPLAHSWILIHPQTEVHLARRKSSIAASAGGSRKLLPDEFWSDSKNSIRPVEVDKRVGNSVV